VLVGFLASAVHRRQLQEVNDCQFKQHVQTSAAGTVSQMPQFRLDGTTLNTSVFLNFIFPFNAGDLTETSEMELVESLDVASVHGSGFAFM